MKQAAIENPVTNSPFRESGWYFKFTDEGITNEVIRGGRTSSYFVPIAHPRTKKGCRQLGFGTEWTRGLIPSIAKQDSDPFRIVSIHGDKDR